MEPALSTSPSPDDIPLAFAALDPGPRAVLRALALGAWPRTRGWVFELLADPALRDSGSPRPTQDAVKLAMAQLGAAGWIVQDERRQGYWSLSPHAEAAAYLQLLEHAPLAHLRAALGLAEGESVLATTRYGQARWASVDVAVARLRLEAYSGADLGRLEQFAPRLPWGVDSVETVLERAVSPCINAPLFARLHPSVQARELRSALQAQATTWVRPLWPAVAMAQQWLEASERGGDLHAELRWALCEVLLLSGQEAAIDAVLQPLRDAGAPVQAARGVAMERAFQAARHAVHGQWAAAEAAGDEALAALRKLTGKRRQLLPETLALLYALSLLAQQTPAHLRKALAFSLSEGGKREPMLDAAAGYLALAVQIRLGDAPRELRPFAPYRDPSGRHLSRLDLWRWMMRAWLKEGAQAESLTTDEEAAAGLLRTALQQAGLTVWSAQLDGALQVLAGEAVAEDFFAGAAPEHWQAALAALQAVAEPAGDKAARPDTGATRLLWALTVDADGSVEALEPYEQKLGQRGWSKPKEVPLSRLHRGLAGLPVPDAALAKAIRAEPFNRGFRVDLAEAVGALVDHPGLVFAHDLGTPVSLSEAGPELDVVDEGAQLRVRMHPSLPATPTAAPPGWVSAAELKAREALRGVFVLRDGPQRARLVRLTPAQQRVAQLLGPQGLEVPRRGVAQLQQVLQGLGSHFRIQADEGQHAQSDREVDNEPRLRAELQPVGDGLQLRLVAAPYGQAHAADGPRFVPGQGRAHLVSTLGGERLGVQRDLALERRHAEDLINACPMLDERGPQDPCEWHLHAPDDALALVERLHQHHAVAALDWPQGRAIRVDSGGLQQLSLKVQTRQDWLAVQGGVAVDEGLVVSLQQLLAFAAASRSRFMPLGEGRYLALTQELRERMDDLAAVAESHAKRGGLAELRVPGVAAPWLQEALQGTTSEVDAAFSARLQALDAAQRVVPAVPADLQASLRPYQEEGYEWAMRLAHAGLGAVLADDMGLGKTLQALAVLVARAAHGPALVVAPTSLIGNWRAEALRFAPTLRIRDYAEGGAPGERAAVLQQAGAHDVVLVSYGLLQIDGAVFAARTWATLVLDEAQAIKNAAAKRSQAVFELQAGFRLALSGTPVENRLAELWSIMRACNPGLLGTQARFNERFAALIERQQDRHAQRTLRRLIAPFLLRRTKAQVLHELPPRTELVLKVTGDERERAYYEALRRDTLQAAERALSGDAPGQAQLNILAGLTRLRRAACDPRLVSPALKMPGAKVMAFGELAAELVANGHKALVFSQFVDFLTLLREPLDAAGLAYQYLDGSTPALERTRRVEAFQRGEGHFFLISLKAGGFGLNLTVADYVVIADPWWNPAAEDQASGRAHRIGQQRPVTVYRLVHEGTLEERILSLHASKRELADSVLDEGGVAQSLPRAEELMALMREDPAGRMSRPEAPPARCAPPLAGVGCD